MKTAFLSGAYKNAGDFLIEQRSLNLLHHFAPNASFAKFLRNELRGKCAQLNDFDAIIIGGGPIYAQTIEKYLPIEELLDVVKSPIMIVGGGWYGSAGSYQQVYDYDFSDMSKQFLGKVDRDGYGLGCRDMFTYRALKKEGFKNVSLTGCPAWYNLDTVSETSFRNDSTEIYSIVVSDPARVENYGKAIEVARYLRNRYPYAKMTFLFHRGLEADKFTAKKTADVANKLKESVAKYCDDIQDISYGGQGFSVYDTCDLHVGFRVHAHIYCLSMRNRSVLIEEDGRGAGVNQILGLPSLKAYSDSIQTNNAIYNKLSRKLGLNVYHHIIEDLETHLDTLSETGSVYFENAFRLQKAYFEQMGEFLTQLSAEIGGR